MKSGGYSRNPFFYALFFGLIPALALSVYRSFYGFDWSDETYYAALSFRFLLGDSIFLNSWDIHQTSSIISLPLIALYRYIVGNTDGILLYLRLCYVMLTGFIAFYALYVFEAKGAILSAAVSACLIVLFVPHNIGAMSYNTLSLQLMFLSWMMIIDDRKRLKNIRLILSGVFFALSVQCYPYLILVLPVYLVWYFFITPSKRNCSIGLNAHYAWMIGVLITCSSFALFIHITSRVNLRELLPTIGYLLTDPEHLNKNYIVSISEYFSSLAGFIGIPGFIICLLSLLSMFLYIPKKNIVSQSVKSTFLITFFVMTTLCFCHVWINLPNGPSSINLLSLPLSLIGPAIYFLIGRKGKALIPLYISGWIFSIAVHLGSNNGFIHSVYPLILCSIAVICYVGEYVKNEKRYRFIKNTMGIIGSLVLMLIVISTVYLRLSYVYRDESIPNLTTRMEIGPAKGIYTTDESALKYKEIIHAINYYTPDDGTILYTKLLPFGYLTKNLRPGTPSVWRTPANSPRLAQYYHLYPELKPSCVFVLDKDYGISNDSNIIDGELSIILNERDYRMIRLECCTIYLKNEEEGV